MKKQVLHLNLILSILFTGVLVFTGCASEETDSYSAERESSAYFSFNGNANDLSEVENDGLVSGATPISDRNNVEQQAYQFDGVDDQIKGTWNQPFSSELTMTAWFQSPGGGKGNPRIVEMSDTSGHYQHSSAIAYGRDGSLRAWTACAITGKRIASVDYSQINYNDNQWHHVVYTYDGSYGKLYVDGELKIISNLETCSDLYDGETFVIGSYYPNTNHTFLGKIDDVKIYDRFMTAEEIGIIFSSQMSIQSVEAGLDVSISPEEIE